MARAPKIVEFKNPGERKFIAKEFRTIEGQGQRKYCILQCELFDINPLRFTQTEAVAAALRQAALFATVRLHSNDPRRVVAKGRTGVVRACKPDDTGDA